MNYKISVAMTTYNGEKYIIDQLESIRTQTWAPDEVIIIDDRSNDRTVNYVQKYIQENQLIGWSISTNPNNYGWKKNFFESVKRTTGDIVFFADQDDIWLPDKIEKMSTAMVANNMGALYGAKIIIDSEGIIKPERMEKKSFSSELFRIPLNDSFYAVKTLGCCMCVSRRIIDSYLSLGYYDGGHDSQCGRLALLLSSLWYFDEPVIQYRIHNNNTSGIAADVSYGSSSLDKRKASLSNSLIWMNLLLQKLELDNDKRELITRCCDAVSKREQYLNGEVCFFSLLKYKRYYSGNTMLIGDFAYRHHLNSILGKIRWKFRRE